MLAGVGGSQSALRSVGVRVFWNVLLFGCLLQVLLGIGVTVKYITTYTAIYGNAKHWFPYIAMFEIGWLLAIPVIAAVVSDVKLTGLRLALFICLTYVACFVMYSIVLHELEHWITRNYFNGTVGANWKCYPRPMYWFGCLSNTLTKFFIFLFLGLMFRFSMLQSHATQQSNELNTLVERLKHEALCNRVRPHFLFNTLNTIASLTVQRPALARDVIGRLGTLLRESLAAMDAQKITLEHECSLIEDYLSIQKARFNDNLTFELTLADRVRECLVPGFIIQPLVENSVKHGMQQCDRNEDNPLHIVVRAELNSQGKVCISVADNGSGRSKERDLNERLGLGLTRQRLHLEYGDGAELVIDEVRRGFSVTMKFDRAACMPSENGRTE